MSSLPSSDLVKRPQLRIDSEGGYTGRTQGHEERIFGGLLMSQAVEAAAITERMRHE